MESRFAPAIHACKSSVALFSRVDLPVETRGNAFTSGTAEAYRAVPAEDATAAVKQKTARDPGELAARGRHASNIARARGRDSWFQTFRAFASTAAKSTITFFSFV